MRGYTSLSVILKSNGSSPQGSDSIVPHAIDYAVVFIHNRAHQAQAFVEHLNHDLWFVHCTYRGQSVDLANERSYRYAFSFQTQVAKLTALDLLREWLSSKLLEDARASFAISKHENVLI